MLSLLTFFAINQIDSWYGYDFYQHKEQDEGDLPETLQVLVKQAENFLEALDT